MGEQMGLFATPAEQRSEAQRAAHDAYLERLKVPGGYQCIQCGGIERNPALLFMNHGIPGTRCLAETFARNHTLYDLRDGHRANYMNATARLRAIAAWRQSLRVPF